MPIRRNDQECRRRTRRRKCLGKQWRRVGKEKKRGNSQQKKDSLTPGLKDCWAMSRARSTRHRLLGCVYQKVILNTETRAVTDHRWLLSRVNAARPS